MVGNRNSRFDLARDRSGTVAIIFAIGMTVVVGFGALGIEGALWYTNSRNVQGAADTAALAAAVAYAAGNTSGFTAEATAVAGANGYATGSNGVTVTVNRPPKSGNNTGNNSAIEVIVVAPEKPLLASLFVKKFNMTGRSVALAGSGSSCVLALGTSGTVVTMNGSPTLTLNNCGIAANSSSASAVSLNGSATLTAASAAIVGNYSLNGSSHLTTPHTVTGAAATADPYANVNVPSFSGCANAGVTVNGSGSQTLNPGVYCGNIAINGSPTVTFNPGTYILDQGSLSINGSPTVSGTGVAFVFTSSTGNNIQGLTVNGSPAVTLTAPTSGAMAGLVFYQDRRAPSGGTDSFNGSPGTNLTGAIYFPNQQVTFNGSASPSACTQLVASSIVFNGSPSFSSNCGGVGVANIGGATNLVE